jgi:uncharacterized membrane protein YcaP (DUF421 family)
LTLVTDPEADMDFDDFAADPGRLAVVCVAGIAVYAAVIVLTRLAGLRSLAKMSSFDFAATVAVGSTLSSTLLGSVPLAAGVLGLAVLFGLQYAIASARRRGALAGLVDNEPVLLMAGDEVLEDNLRHVRMSRAELWSQLRQAGVHHRGQVLAVVLETTGDISVIRAGEAMEPELLDGVRGAEALRC